MNRRNLLKTLFGTSVAITIPWAIPKEPWMKLKARSTELIKKWKPILEYESNDIAPLSKDKWSDMACLMEYTELKFTKYHKNGSIVCNYLIPAIRRYEGKVDYKEGKDCDRQYVEFNPFNTKDVHNYYWLNDRHYYWVELQSPNRVRCYLT